MAKVEKKVEQEKEVKIPTLEVVKDTTFHDKHETVTGIHVGKKPKFGKSVFNESTQT